MIANVIQHSHESQPADWREGFMELLPAILRQARIAARGLDEEAREERIQEIVCNCLAAYERLWAAGKSDVAYPSVLVRFAAAQIRSGRRVGAKLNCRDVASRYAQQKHGFAVARLDHFDRETQAWEEIAVEDKRSSPAEIAALRIDFADWSAGLPKPLRKIANLLATGESTHAAAERFRLSPGRISQIRRELKRSWEAFQGETSVAAGESFVD